MDWFVPLLLGLIAGFGIELLIDIFYWRRTRICNDAELQLQDVIGRIENENAQYQQEINRLHGEVDRVPRLEADLDARTAQYNGLLADIEERKRRENSLSHNIKSRDGEAKAAQALRNRVLEMETQLKERDNEIARMYTDYESRGAQVSGLGTKLTDLESTVQERDLEINALKTALEMKDKDIANMQQSTVSRTAFSDSSTDADARIAALETELASRESALQAAQARLSQQDARLSPHQPAPDSDREMTEMLVLPDDSNDRTYLGMIWGLNSDVEQALDASGIYNYNALASSQPDDVDNALEVVRKNYGDMDKQSIHNSWIDQSRLAREGEWDALNAYQRRNFDVESGRDDLKLLWGIGPKIEEFMNDNGIYTFAQIAAVPGHRLSEILQRAGSRFRASSEKLQSTWPEQARLAEKGDLDGLAKFQSELNNKL